MKIVQGNYTVISPLGSPESFVKLAYSSYLNAKVALKVEDFSSSFLLKEYKNLSILRGLTGVPEVLDYGRKANYSYMATELLGQNLRLHESSGNLSFLVTMIYQAVEALKQIHTVGFVHGNLSPNHFVVGKGNKEHFLYIIDFSRAESFDAQNVTTSRISTDLLENLEHEFCSLNVSYGGRCRPRDDLESLIYCLIWLYKRSLPWIPENAKFNQPHIIKNLKLAVNIDQICMGCPQEFRQILSYCRGLKNSDKLDYNYIQTLLKDLTNRISKEEGPLLFTPIDIIKYNRPINRSSSTRKLCARFCAFRAVKSYDLISTKTSKKLNLDSTSISELSSGFQLSSSKNSSLNMDFNVLNGISDSLTSGNKYSEFAILLRNSVKISKKNRYIEL